MAFLQEDDKLQNDQQDPNKQNQQFLTQSSPLVGQSSGDVGGGVSTAGTGPGGQGSWTNIQAYLGANQGDTGSAKNLDKEVGGQFDKEKSDLQSSSSKVLSDAKTSADKALSTNDASQILNSSVEANRNKNQDVYSQNVSRVQQALNGPYSGPTSYNYGISGQTQDYGQSLQGNGFDSLMKNLYAKNAGQGLSSGQYALQKQLDVGNKALEDTRSSLLNKYNDLQGLKDQTVSNVGKQLGDYAKSYADSQTALRDYLNNSLTDFDKKNTQAEADARSAYELAKKQGSGNSSLLYDLAANLPTNQNTSELEWALSKDPSHRYSNDQWQQFLDSNGIWGNNLSYDQLLKERDNKNSLVTDWGDNITAIAPEQGKYNKHMIDLNNFLSDQDNANRYVGDTEKRSYNALLDFLGLMQPKKETDNFSVTGENKFGQTQKLPTGKFYGK